MKRKKVGFFYRVNRSFQKQFPHAVTLVNGVAVALNEKGFNYSKPGTSRNPPQTISVKAATQKDLEYLYEKEQNPFIEKIQDA